MAKIARKTQKIFAVGAANNGQFGSAVAGTKVLSTDLDVLQNLAAWTTGWLTATISGQQLPCLEEMQGIQYVATSQIAYGLQEGIPEYDVGTTYFQNSIVKKAGTYQLFGSVTDNNIGNALTDPTNWLLLVDLSNLNTGDIGAIKSFATSTLQANYLPCNGAAVSRTTYAGLFAKIGTTWGVGDGATTFNVPSTARATLIGSGGSGTGVIGNAVGNTGGEETHTLTSGEMPSHVHDKGTSSPAVVTSGGIFTASTGTGLFTGSAGGDGPHNNMQPSAVVSFQIKYV